MGSANSALEDWVLGSLEEEAVVLPTFPMVAVRLVDALEQPNVEVDEVCNLLSQDPSIASQVIRIANSAYYGAISPIVDIRGATMRLGFSETTRVAMSAACRALFEVEDRAELEVYPDAWRQLWTSALVGAYGARLIALESKLGDPGDVFLSALFRDVGSLLLLKLVSSGLVHGRLVEAPTTEELASLLSTHHERLGADYLRRSRLPEYVVEVAADHHGAAIERSSETEIALVVRLADGLCHRLGINAFEADEATASMETSAELLGFDGDRLEYFALQVEALREELRDLT